MSENAYDYESQHTNLLPSTYIVMYALNINHFLKEMPLEIFLRKFHCG